jgi:hypothetical protein
MCLQPGRHPCSRPNTALTRPNRPVSYSLNKSPCLLAPVRALIQTFPRCQEPTFTGPPQTTVIDPLRALGSANGDGGFGGHCEPCRGCWLIDGRNLRIPGISYSGGYAEAIVAHTDALAAIPD